MQGREYLFFSSSVSVAGMSWALRVGVDAEDEALWAAAALNKIMVAVSFLLYPDGQITMPKVRYVLRLLIRFL